MAHILFLLFSLFLSASPGQSHQIDSLQNAVKNAKADTNEVKSLNALCKQLDMSGNFDSALAYGEKAQALAEKLAFKKGIADALSNLGLIYFFQENCPKAQDYYFKALAIYQEMMDKGGIATTFSHIGLLYGYEGNSAKAEDYMLKALVIEQEINDLIGSANTYIAIGDIYCRQGNYPMAIEYTSRALEVSQKIDNKNIRGHILFIMGNIYETQGNYKNALEYYYEALPLFQETNYKNGIAVCLTKIGSTYKMQGNYYNAMEAEYKALAIARKAKDKRSITLCYQELIELNIKRKNYQRAKLYADSALTSANAIENIGVAVDIYRQLSQVDSALGLYSAAFADYKKYIIRRDSVISENNAKKTVQVEMNYEFEQKQASEKAEQDRKEAIYYIQEINQKAESKRQKILIGLFASITIMLILLVVLIFQRMKGVEKKRLLTEQQKSWLELKALRTQMNPHFLYNTINSIQSFVLENDIKSSVNYLAQFASLMRGVLENSRKDKITLADEIDGLYNYLDFEVMRFPARFNYQIKIDDSLDKAKTLLPPLLIQPYVENSIWHGLMHLENSGGEVVIIFEKIDHHIKCTIDDNGIGRKAAVEIKNKSIQKPVGMSIVAERMESMNRIYHWNMRIDITDKLTTDGTSAGTKVELYLPLIFNTVVCD